ncbi:MAG: Uma2 family endonuclease [Isosphaeraceae bacterium]
MATGTKRIDGRKPGRRPVPVSSDPEPVWEIARLFPKQGEWSEEEFFSLPNNHKIEFSDGRLEFLPMPTIYHQLILQYIYDELKPFVRAARLGIVVITGYKVRVPRGKDREPDILFIKTENMSGIGKQYCEKADLVVEVVSEENRPHDIETKRVEYAQAGIPEYWIVDPQEETITVLVLKPRRKSYTVHGKFTKGMRATSMLLPGFSIDVTTAVTQKPELPE